MKKTLKLIKRTIEFNTNYAGLVLEYMKLKEIRETSDDDEFIQSAQDQFFGMMRLLNIIGYITDSELQIVLYELSTPPNKI